MKKKILICLVLLCITALSAQELSIKKGIFLSALAPGLGQLYAKNYTKSGLFIASEFAIVFSYFRFQAEKDWSIDSYQKFAYNMAEVPMNSDDSYYQLIQDFQTSDEYNLGVESFARNVYLSTNSPYYNPENYYAYLNSHLIPEDYSWNWGNSKNWNRYKNIRRDKQDYEIYANFALAAAILNRIVSVVDSAISIRSINSKNGLSNLTFSPDWENKGVRVNYEYKF